jgi:hypothetical protein
MRLLQTTIRTIKHFQHGQATKSQNKKEGVGVVMLNIKKCVECGGHVPAYMNYLCEDCWRIALNEKLEAEDAAEFIEQAKRNPK